MSIKKSMIILLMSLSLVGCVNSNDNKEVNETDITNEAGSYQKFDKTFYEYFDTVSILLSYQKDEADFKKYAEILEEELDKYNKLYNSYEDFDGINNIKTINDNAGIKEVKVDREIIDLILYSKDMYEKTNGKINVALGSVLSLWHDAREFSVNNRDKARLPDPNDLKEASQHRDIEKVIVDEDKGTVFIEDSDIRLDIGAIGKGYATKKISEKLIEEGFTDGIVSVGGDDVIIGSNPSSKDKRWRIAIENPFKEDKKNDSYADIINVGESSVVTSGDYQRFFTVDGKNYHHIIDPDTLYPSTRWKSVSLIADDIALADTFSTYLFLIDRKEGEKVAKENNIEVLWIDHDGNKYETDGWKKVRDK